MTETVTWQCESGAYAFQLCTPDGDWNDVGGVYILTSPNGQNRWRALYVGQTHSFRERCGNHPQWGSAQLLGATHICALVVPQEATRIALEAALIRALQPPLNSRGVLGDPVLPTPRRF